MRKGKSYCNSSIWEIEKGLNNVNIIFSKTRLLDVYYLTLNKVTEFKCKGLFVQQD